MWILLMLLLLLPFIAGGLSLAPWVPTFPRDTQRLRDILPDGAQNFLEVGSGSGGVSIFVAQNWKEYRVRGIEIAFPLFVFSFLRGKLSRLPNLSFRLGNALRHDFHLYDIIYIYGLPENMVSKILPKFRDEMKSGAMLISYTFSFPKEFEGNRCSFSLPGRNTIHTITKK